MARPAHRRHLRDGIGEQFGLGQPFVGELMDEAGISAILQQPPDEIGQQIAVAADGRVDPAMIAIVAHQPLVQPVAHAVQPLKFEVARIARPCDDRRDGQRVVAGESGADMGCGQHVARAGEIGHVGRRLAREQRIVSQPLDLGSLDLAVPIGALDEADIPALADFARECVRPGDHRACPLRIALNGHAEAVPSLEPGLAHRSLDDVEAHVEPLGLLGVDGQLNANVARQRAQQFQTRCQFGNAAIILRHFIAGMQRRQLDRH